MDKREAIVDWVLGLYARPKQSWETPPIKHLINCPDTRITFEDAYDGTYGCETGCEFYRVSGTIWCSHGAEDEFDYGDFGELMDRVPDVKDRVGYGEIES